MPEKSLSLIFNFYNKHRTVFAAIQLILFLYLFIFSLQLLGDSLKLFGASFSRTLVETTSNPFVGLFIGILATSVIQSSSSTTSIVVGLVAGGALTIDTAIPIIMGANIGTSVTSFIAAFPQINRTSEFKRAFAAATVHDFFNLLSVFVLFPLQLFTNFLGKTATFLANVFANVGGLNFLSPVKLLTKPVAQIVIRFIGEDSAWVIFVIALLLLFIALKYMVNTLKVLVITNIKAWFDKVLFKTSVRAFFVGLLLTILVQSSSITVSLMVPLASAGLLTLIQIFPYALGANVGTTVTAILAALLTGNISAVIVAFSHLVFNLSGIIIWAPLKFIPIKLTMLFADFSTRNKLIPFGFVLFVFFLLPLFIIYISN